MNEEVVIEILCLILGILLIIFRKQFAVSVMQFHRKRLRKRTKKKLEAYPEEIQSKAWSAASRATEIMAVIVGAWFVISVILAWLGIGKR